MRTTIGTMVAVGCLIAACTTESARDVIEGEVVDVEVSEAARAIGIARFHAFSSATALEIEALSDDGTVVGRLELTTGRFVMQDDDRGDVDGRRMTVDVLEQRTVHESEGYLDLQLPVSSLSAEIRAFLLDPSVTTQLAHRGIELDAADVGAADALDPEETPYISCPFGFTDYYHNNGGSSCQNTWWGGCSNGYGMASDRGGWWGELRCCPQGTQGSFNERSCTSPMSGSPCGQTGGGGCALCWSTWYVGQSCYVWPEGNGSCTGAWCT